jgi:hypothetical protein
MFDLYFWTLVLMIGLLNFNYNAELEKNLRYERARKNKTQYRR